MRTGSGKRRDEVVLRDYTQTKDAIGGYSATVDESLTVWADVRPMQGSRRVEYNQFIEGSPYDVKLDYYDAPNIDFNWTIEYNGEELQIHSVVKKDLDDIHVIAYGRKS